MAVTIIKKGSLDNAPTYTRTCPECQTEFSYQYADTKFCGWMGGYRMIECPLCHYPVAHINNGSPMNHPEETD